MNGRDDTPRPGLLDAERLVRLETQLADERGRGNDHAKRIRTLEIKQAVVVAKVGGVVGGVAGVVSGIIVAIAVKLLGG